MPLWYNMTSADNRGHIGHGKQQSMGHMTEVNQHDAADAIRLSEFAAAMGAARRTARRWLKAGRVPGAFQTPGGHWRVPREAVEQLKRAA
jgi:excisionase family DNA binding protein